LSPKGIFAIALAAGLITVVAMDITYRPHLMAEDSADYVQLADSLLAGRGYTLSSGIAGTRIPPLFPVLLAGDCHSATLGAHTRRPSAALPAGIMVPWRR